ncbi:GtrA family protein [Ruminococcaceae bacterium OttesenSCG-928-I18]|nr:GtrA family protein [Ruminococcaceae bacterium OttesenSCG-928-I18]
MLKQLKKIKLFAFFWDRSLLIFLIIGGLNTILSYAGSFFLNYVVGWSLFASTATMYALCSIPSFYFNRKFSFQSKAPLGRSILRFAIIISGCFLLSYSLNHLIVPWMYAHWFPNMPLLWYTLLRLLGIQVVFTALNYTSQRLWAFKE